MMRVLNWRSIKGGRAAVVWSLSRHRLACVSTQIAALSCQIVDA